MLRLTPFVFFELFMVCLAFVISIGVSVTMHIGINNTCASISHGSVVPK